jgi:hypothetical protein
MWTEQSRRQLLLGHKAGHVTTHYSAPEIEALIQASEKVCALGAPKTHANFNVAATRGSELIGSEFSLHSFYKRVETTEPHFQ